MKKQKLLVTGLSILLTTACGKGINGGPTITVNPILGSSKAAVNQFQLRPFQMVDMGGPNFLTMLGTNYLGAATAAGLLELKYYIQEIQICESLSSNGTAYSNPSGCAVLYKADDSNTDTSYTIAQAQADTDPGHFLDLTDMVTTKAKINSGVTISSGTYNYGIVNWKPVVKVKANVTLGSGTVLHTPAQTHLTETNTSGGYTYTSDADLSTVAVGESLVNTGNGGSFFKFQTPFVYDGSTQEVIDLVFNPDGIIQGASGGTVSNFKISYSNYSQAINVPIIALTPVVHAAGDSAMKEVYLIKGHNADADLRVELYYAKSDSTKAIRGVDMRQVYNSGAATIMGAYFAPTQLQSVTVNADSTVNFNDWKGVSIISGFKRLTTVGATGTVSFNCNQGSKQDTMVQGSWCTADGTTDSSGLFSSPSYSLVSIEAVQ